MGDIELTRDEWRMANHAGAAFNDESPTHVEHPFGQQLQLAGVGPEMGALYRNRHTDQIGCVVRLRQGRKGWVTLRVSDRLTDVLHSVLAEHWAPCRPDGRLL